MATVNFNEKEIKLLCACVAIAGGIATVDGCSEEEYGEILNLSEKVRLARDNSSLREGERAASKFTYKKSAEKYEKDGVDYILKWAREAIGRTVIDLAEEMSSQIGCGRAVNKRLVDSKDRLSQILAFLPKPD